MNVAARFARPELLDLPECTIPSARRDALRMHANENPHVPEGAAIGETIHRYPDPYPNRIEQALASLYEVPRANVLATRGSDEGIDLLMRAFCGAGRDSIVTFSPTFGMYAFFARVQGAAVVDIETTKAGDFAIDEEALAQRSNGREKLVFFCSPNNPTGNVVDPALVARMLAARGPSSLVVVDEAYVEFTGRPSLFEQLGRHENLIVLRTLSKAYGLAGARCGAVLASEDIIELLRRIRTPYALGERTAQHVSALLEPERRVHTRAAIAALVSERERVRGALSGARDVRKVWPSEANFLLVEITDRTAVERLAAASIVVREFSNASGLESCVRITIGTAADNDRLLAAWESR